MRFYRLLCIHAAQLCLNIILGYQNNSMIFPSMVVAVVMSFVRYLISFHMTQQGPVLLIQSREKSRERTHALRSFKHVVIVISVVLRVVFSGNHIKGSLSARSQDASSTDPHSGTSLNGSFLQHFLNFFMTQLSEEKYTNRVYSQMQLANNSFMIRLEAERKAPQLSSSGLFLEKIILLMISLHIT